MEQEQQNLNQCGAIPETSGNMPEKVVSPTIINAPKKTSAWKIVLYVILGFIGGIVLVIGAIIFGLFSGVSKMVKTFDNTTSTSNIHIDQESGVYKFGGYLSSGKKTSYNLSLSGDDSLIYDEENGTYTYDDNKFISLSNADYPWLDSVYNYKSYIDLYLEFSGGLLSNRKILDKSGNDLGEVSQINWISLVDESDVSYLSEYSQGDTFKVEEYGFVYNDTAEDQQISITDYWGDSSFKTLESGDVYINDDFRSVEIALQ